MPVKCRLIEEVGTRAWLRVYWGNDCQVTKKGQTFNSFHNAKILLGDSDTPRDWDMFGKVDDYPDEQWPTKCDTCGQAPPEDARRQIFKRKLYNTESGHPEPGDMFWADWAHHEDDDGNVRCYLWDNCKDPRGHLYAVCPDGTDWDIDGRATNCTMPKDKTHRCWVREGEPPNVTAGKKGHTCSAGAGSIAVPGYHGFLRNGSFT